MSRLPASLKMIQLKVKKLSSGQHVLHFKSIEIFFDAQGRVTWKWIVQSGPKSNSLKILWLSLLPARLTKIQSIMKSLSSGRFLHVSIMGKFFIAEAWVTPKWIIQSGPKSNSLQILWLCFLSASLTKIWSNMKSLSSGQHFHYYKSTWAISKVLKGKILQSQ